MFEQEDNYPSNLINTLGIHLSYYPMTLLGIVCRLSCQQMIILADGYLNYFICYVSLLSLLSVTLPPHHPITTSAKAASMPSRGMSEWLLFVWIWI